MHETIIEDGVVYDYHKNDSGQYWFYDGNLHRLNGPAVMYNDGRNIWWYHGKIHRLDGPAVDYPYSKEWYYQGTKIECSSQEEFERLLKLKAFW